MLFSRKIQETIPPTQSIKSVSPELGNEQGMKYTFANLQGLGTRPQQEDAFGFGNALDDEAIAEHGLLAVVADGMGGMEGGRIASMATVSEVFSSFETFNLDEELPEQLNEAVKRAQHAVFDELEGSGGSTVIIALVYHEQLYFSSVGDSFLFLLHDRNLIQLNYRQTVLNRDLKNQLRKGEMDLGEAMRNPEKNAITQYLGMPEEPEPDYLRRSLKLYPGDVLLLCSDGVGGVLEPSCIENCLCRSAPDEMCNALNAEIQKRNLKYQDNYTALIVQCRK